MLAQSVSCSIGSSELFGSKNPWFSDEFKLNQSAERIRRRFQENVQS